MDPTNCRSRRTFPAAFSLREVPTNGIMLEVGRHRYRHCTEGSPQMRKEDWPSQVRTVDNNASIRMSPLHVPSNSTGCLPVLPPASFRDLKGNNFESVCVSQVSFPFPVSMIASGRELSRSSAHLLVQFTTSNRHAFSMMNLLLTGTPALQQTTALKRQE